MWRGRSFRRRIAAVDGWPAFEALLDTLRAPLVVVLDVQPAVAHWCATATEVEAALDAVAQRLLARDDVGAVWFVSNGQFDTVHLAQFHPQARLVTRARKPRVPSGLARATVGTIVVCGDQLLTDGLLAWRLGALFVLWEHDGPAPAWPRIQSVLGRCVAPLLFRSR